MLTIYLHLHSRSALSQPVFLTFGVLPTRMKDVVLLEVHARIRHRKGVDKTLNRNKM